MKFVQQQQSLSLDKVCCESTKKIYRHGNLLPTTIRCIICGPSSCGKTNVMIGLLIHKNGLRYRNVYLYSKTLFQPKYVFLDKVLTMVPEIKFTKYRDNEEVISSQTARPNSVMVFDDVAGENQNNIRDYFAIGRHKNIDSFYLNQTYSKIPKQLIRDNANLLVVFKQDDVNLRHIYDEHVTTDMSWKQFREMCKNIWSEPYSYLVINKDCEKNNGRYRMKFDKFVVFE